MFHPCPTTKSQKYPRVMINYMIILVMTDLTTLLRHLIWKPPSGSKLCNWSCNYLPTRRAHSAARSALENGHAIDGCSSCLWKWDRKSEEDGMESIKFFNLTLTCKKLKLNQVDWVYTHTHTHRCRNKKKGGTIITFKALDSHKNFLE